MRHKFNVSPPEARTRDGIKFASKKEMHRYDELVILKRGGEVLTFLVQAPAFRLPGGVRYTADFLVFWADGRVTVEDVKGMRTESYKAKKRMVEAMYAPITIEEL